MWVGSKASADAEAVSWMVGSEEKHEDPGAHWLLLTAGEVLKKKPKLINQGSQLSTPGTLSK